jgi:hypothetical protein
MGPDRVVSQCTLIRNHIDPALVICRYPGSNTETYPKIIIPSKINRTPSGYSSALISPRPSQAASSPYPNLAARPEAKILAVAPLDDARVVSPARAGAGDRVWVCDSGDGREGEERRQAPEDSAEKHGGWAAGSAFCRWLSIAVRSVRARTRLFHA